MSRRHFLTIPILIFFLCMLSFPQTVFAGASYGLLLWFRHVLPTLLPYMVLINILIRTPALHWICHITSPFLCPLLGTSYYGTFAVLTGFLCGYPMGAKTASDLLDAQKISRSEASYLLSFCNNTSPAFILSYVVIQNLKKDSISIPFLLILTLTPLMMSFVFRLFYRAKDHIHPFSHMMQVSSSTASQSENLSGNYFDRCIMNAFESITKVGGYMMMFSVLIHCLRLLFQTIQPPFFCIPAWRSAPESDGLRHPHCIPPIRLFCALHLPLSAAGAVLPRHIP